MLTVCIAQIPAIVDHHQSQRLGVEDLLLARSLRRIRIRCRLDLGDLLK